VLDKTGTLTLGVSKVTGIVAANGASEEAILQFAVIAEQHSVNGIQLIRRAAQLDSYAAAFRDRGRLGSLDGWTMVVNVRTCAV
jgi:hypothetical protein